MRIRYQIFIRFNKLLEVKIDKNMKEEVTFQKRMSKYANYLFNFLIHPDIPPDNNASERAIWNFKEEKKVSGFCKSIEGANLYAVLRSIIDYTVKSAQNPFCVLRAIAAV
jgi:transposase